MKEKMKEKKQNKMAIVMIAIVAISVTVSMVGVSGQPAQPVLIRGDVIFENETRVPDGWLVNLEDTTDVVYLGNDTTEEIHPAVPHIYEIQVDPSSIIEGHEIKAWVRNGNWYGEVPHTVQSGENDPAFPLMMEDIIVSEEAPTPKVVINEFVSDNATEWVELYNNGSSPVDLTGWTLEDEAGTSKSLSSLGTIGVDGYKVFTCASGWLNNGGDIIWLNSTTENVDRVGYGTSGGAPAPDVGNSTGRYPNGVDTDNDAADFREFGTPTPGTANELPAEEDTTAPTTEVTIPPDTTSIPSGEELPWTNGDVVISFRRTDNGGGNPSGVNYTNLSTSGTAPWTMMYYNGTINDLGNIGLENISINLTTPIPYNFTINVTAEGTTKIYYYSVDNATNDERDKLGYTPNVTVRIDTVAPTIDVKSPASGAPDVPVTTDITAHFDSVSPMNSSTLTTDTVIVVNSTDSSVTGIVTYDDATQNVTFTPMDNLEYSETYNVTVTTGVKDLAGNAMESNYSWEFTTAEEPAPPADKWAVLIGIADYPGTENDLDSPDNDVADMYDVLTERSGFAPDHILMLLNESATKANIADAIETWLANNEAADDTVVIYYSGHGSYDTDDNGDEIDGYDECPNTRSLRNHTKQL